MTSLIRGVAPWAVALLTLALLVVGCSSVDPEIATDLSSTASTTAASTAGAGQPDTDQLTTVPQTHATSTTELSTTAPPTTAAPWDAPLPIDASSLAQDLTTTERAIRDPEVGLEPARNWGERLQRLYRVLSANRDWADQTVANVGDDVRPDVELNWAARQDLSSLVNSTTLSSNLPAWRLRDPLPVEELIGYYEEAEDITGVPWEILASINLIETRMGRIEGTSTAGAVGPMQFLPSTWTECCAGDPALDRDAIIGAATYLVQRGAATDIDRALFGYNNSDRYVRAVRSYAEVIERDRLAYRGYHAFQVYFLSSAGLILMPSGYEEFEPVDVDSWLADHPEALID
ncbi:MAG: hypothetical protein ACI8TP_000777 [Acidimicrobiales bacterium]|jgi:hypothetical protein